MKKVTSKFLSLIFLIFISIFFFFIIFFYDLFYLIFQYFFYFFVIYLFFNYIFIFWFQNNLNYFNNESNNNRLDYRKKNLQFYWLTDFCFDIKIRLKIYTLTDHVIIWSIFILYTFFFYFFFKIILFLFLFLFYFWNFYYIIKIVFSWFFLIKIEIYINIENLNSFILSFKELITLFFSIPKVFSFIFLYSFLEMFNEQNNNFFLNFKIIIYLRILGFSKITFFFIELIYNWIRLSVLQEDWKKKYLICWPFIFIYNLIDNFSFNLNWVLTPFFKQLNGKKIIVNLDGIWLNNPFKKTLFFFLRWKSPAPSISSHDYEKPALLKKKEHQLLITGKINSPYEDKLTYVSVMTSQQSFKINKNETFTTNQLMTNKTFFFSQFCCQSLISNKLIRPGLLKSFFNNNFKNKTQIEVWSLFEYIKGVVELSIKLDKSNPDPRLLVQSEVPTKVKLLTFDEIKNQIDSGTEKIMKEDVDQFNSFIYDIFFPSSKVPDSTFNLLNEKQNFLNNINNLKIEDKIELYYDYMLWTGKINDNEAIFLKNNAKFTEEELF